ncbi:Tetratricopeptide-like helical [Penicillium expansum]|nr:Tetratricopeptide-like helical [Penicillium expansum]
MATSTSFGGVNSGIQTSILNGTVNAQFHLPPGKFHKVSIDQANFLMPASPLKFVDRGTLFDQINAKGSVPGSRIALVGLGGVGKSQLAIEYCYRVRDQSPETWVLWIHASNATRIEQSCRDLADRLRIPGRQDPKANVFKLLHDWLNDERKGKWVLILDNLDDEKSLHTPSPVTPDGLGNDQSGTQGRSIWAYLQENLNGLIIITSRSRRVVSRMVEDSDIIPVEPMDETHAITLFEKKLGAQAASEDVIQLTAALEFMPLAIVQAAAYIKQRLPRLSVTQYLETFRRSDHQKTSLLQYEGGQLRRDREAKNSILITWQISFDYILQESPSAADLLSLMSFFDRQGIPDSLIRDDKETKHKIHDFSISNEDLRMDASDKERSASDSVVDRFEDDILVLKEYSLISISPDETKFEMHRLVQLAMQEWLKAHIQLEKWQGQFIRILYSKFPSGTFENWIRCQLLFAHVQNAVVHQPDTKDLLGEWASLLHEASSFALIRGNFVDSRRMAHKAAIARAKLFGPDNAKTLDSFSMLGEAYILGGQWKEAEELHLQVMETRKQVLGPAHPDTLASMSNLASTYRGQGRWKEAEELGVQVMDTQKQVLGPAYPDTLTSMSNLALIYRGQGRWKEAEELAVQVIEANKQVLGPEHPNTLVGMNNLASIYQGQGRWKEAEELAVQVMDTRKQVLGPAHPGTLTSISNLASIYQGQGRWKEAEELAVQVIEAYKQVLGPEHPNTLIGMSNLALIYRGQGRWKEAEELAVQVMDTQKQVLGPEHPDTLTSMSILALTYHGQGRWKEAEELRVQGIETQKQVLGPEHPDTLTSMGILALTYWDQGRWKEAEELEVQVMDTRKRVLGPEHPNTLISMTNLASIYQGQGQWKEAEELAVQVIDTQKQVLGPEHPDTLISIGNLALNYWNQGRWKEAEELGVQVIDTQKQVLGPAHRGTLTSMSNLALIYQDQGRWKEAEELKMQVMDTRKRVLGPEHPDTLISIGNLALNYWNQGRWKEAEELGVQVIDAQKQVLGPEHPDTLTSMGILALTYRDQGRWKEAEELEVQVMDTRKRVLGPEHPDTLISVHNLAHNLWSSCQEKPALLLMTECVRLREQKLGPDHPDTMFSKSTLDEWRGKDLSSQSTKVPIETNEEGRIQFSHTESSEQISKTRGNRKRTIFSRLFRRN